MFNNLISFLKNTMILNIFFASTLPLISFADEWDSSDVSPMDNLVINNASEKVSDADSLKACKAIVNSK